MSWSGVKCFFLHGLGELVYVLAVKIIAHSVELSFTWKDGSLLHMHFEAHPSHRVGDQNPSDWLIENLGHAPKRSSSAAAVNLNGKRRFSIHVRFSLEKFQNLLLRRGVGDIRGAELHLMRSARGPTSHSSRPNIPPSALLNAHYSTTLAGAIISSHTGNLPAVRRLNYP
jgi:hypothetical protein